MKKIKRALRKIQFFFRDMFINKKNRKRLKNSDFSIICSDCTAGCIYKDLKSKFCSPTINMYIESADFIKFVTNLKDYLFGELQEIPSDGGYPKVKIVTDCGEVLIHCLHYKTAQQFIEKWTERKERVKFDNLFIMMTDRNGFVEKDLADFDRLPYKNKICFTHKPMEKYASAFYVKGSEKDEFVKPMMSYVRTLGIKRHYDKFDYVNWLNDDN